VDEEGGAVSLWLCRAGPVPWSSAASSPNVVIPGGSECGELCCHCCGEEKRRSVAPTPHSHLITPSSPRPMNAVAVYEQQVLNEYSRVSSNLNQVSPAPLNHTRLVYLDTHRSSTDCQPRSCVHHAELGDSQLMRDWAESLASAQPATLEALRPMERKMGLVLTLFKGECA
jgi:hypothetical protein